MRQIKFDHAFLVGYSRMHIPRNSGLAVDQPCFEIALGLDDQAQVPDITIFEPFSCREHIEISVEEY